MLHRPKQRPRFNPTRIRAARLSAALVFTAISLLLGAPVFARSKAQTSANPAEPNSRATADAHKEPGSANQERAVRLARQLAGESQARQEGAAGRQSKATASTRVASETGQQNNQGSSAEKKLLGGSSQTANSKGKTSPGLGGDSGWVLNTLTALGVVIGLVFLVKWAYQKMAGAKAVAPSSAVEVLCRSSVAPKNHVLLLRVGQRVLVVSDSTQGLRTLSEVDDPEEVASLLQAVTAERDNSLSDNFSRLMSRYQSDATSTQTARGPTERQASDADDGQIDRTHAQVSNLLGRVRSLGSSGKGGVR